MMLDSIFRCAQCGVAVSGTLKYLHDLELLQDWERQTYSPPDLVPLGFYTTAASVEASGAMWEEFCPRDEIIFNRHDLITHPTLINERDGGCCGSDGSRGANVFCINGHGFATEFADCWGIHYVHSPREMLKQEAA